MTDYQIIRELLEPWGELKSQDGSEWSGEISLPVEIEKLYKEVGPWGEVIYEEVGPIGSSIETIGGPVRIPPLYKLWDLQEGYRWDGNTRERLKNWKDDWLVIAALEADPFVLNINDGNILFGLHGQGVWNLQLFAPSIEKAFGILSTIGLALVQFGDDGYDDDSCEYTRELINFIEKQLVAYLNNRDHAKRVLDMLG